jgi:hypothetical protein
VDLAGFALGNSEEFDEASAGNPGAERLLVGGA